MKIFIICLIVFLNIKNLYSRNIGETEITADEGLEVFQNEKYYLLKKNVKIESDNFVLLGDNIKIFFQNDMYDIKIIDAFGNVKLDSPQYNVNALGEKLYFIIADEDIHIEGINSKLITTDMEMYSDGIIKVNNSIGDFSLKGFNSKLISEDIIIEGENINGKFSVETDTRKILELDVYDNNIAYVNNIESEMYANSIKYNKNDSLIILEDNVKIISDGEIITGDYGTLDTHTNSYKIRSKDSKKVKVIITNNDE